MIVVWAVLAGGVGAALRFMVDSVLRPRFPEGLPAGTIIINVVGSFALGWVLGWVRLGVLPVDAATVVGTGLLGGFTTFSTAAVELVRLVEQKRLAAAVAQLAFMAGGSVAAAAAGFWLAGVR